MYSDFSIDAILGPKPGFQKIIPSPSVSPRSDISSSSECEELASLYFKSLAWQQLQLAKIQLMPPSWSQKQQKQASKSRKYSTAQTEILTKRYEKSPYINRQEMSELAAKTDLSMLQVKIWFQNRRLKARKTQGNAMC